MDSDGLSSLDFSFIARELNDRLRGGTFRKIYQPGRKRLLFEVHSPASGEQLLYADGRRAFLASGKGEIPGEPPAFCMLLRKHLMGRAIREVRQHGFERVLEIETEDSILILEFVPPGNVILCDKYYNIIMPLEVQRWKHREVRPKASYAFPPEKADLRKMEIWDFFTAISGIEKPVSSALSGMGLGKSYSGEACARSGIKADRPASTVTVEEATELFKSLKEMTVAQPEPCVYSGVVSAFPLRSVPGPCRPMSSMSEAVEYSFAKDMKSEEDAADRSAQDMAEDEARRAERIEQARSEAKDVLAAKKEEMGTKAQLIYRHYDIVSNALRDIRAARDSGLDWQQIRERLSASRDSGPSAVKEIRENEGTIVLSLDGSDVEVDIRKTAEENAGGLFNRAKRLGKKIKRIEWLQRPKPMTMEDIQYSLTGKGIGVASSPGPQAMQPETAEPATAAPATAAAVSGVGAHEGKTGALKSRKYAKPGKGRRWYETYRWFVSSEGNIVVAGKNALQNDSVIKSRAKPGDAVFHADVHGAAFVVAKANEKGEVGPLTIKEASEFAAAHSKAWSAGFTEVDVLQFRPESLGKTTPDGRKLPRGSFYAARPLETHGKVEVKLAVGAIISELDGVAEARVVAGPIMTVRKSCKYFVTIQPGGVESSELAQKIRNGLLAKCLPEDRRAIEAIPADEFARRIPSGAGSLVG